MFGRERPGGGGRLDEDNVVDVVGAVKEGGALKIDEGGALKMDCWRLVVSTLGWF